MTRTPATTNDTSIANAQRVSRLNRVIGQVTVLELIALGIAIISIVLFALLARAVLRSELVAFNRGALEAIHMYATPTLDTVALAVTFLGSFECVVVIGVALGVWFLRSKRRVDAWVLATVLLGGGALSQTLKAVFAQTRPDVFDPLYRAAGLSFPSGH
ncbi:MAG: hypothetical protein H7X80_04345, partial [bacterium]|nr:hypothetical protein [Candidatus Kapabacteria bacterium]